MVINYLHVGLAGRISEPLKANPQPLLIDADAVLTLAVAFQRL
jgi:hypothetical protein